MIACRKSASWYHSKWVKNNRFHKWLTQAPWTDHYYSGEPHVWIHDYYSCSPKPNRCDHNKEVLSITYTCISLNARPINHQTKFVCPSRKPEPPLVPGVFSHIPSSQNMRIQWNRNRWNRNNVSNC